MHHLYRPQSKLQEGSVFTPICQSFCSRGWGRGLSQHAMGRGVSASGSKGCKPPLDTHLLGRHPLDTHTTGQKPPGKTFPWEDTPLGRHPPPSWPLKWAVHILLERILVSGNFVTFDNKFLSFLSRVEC